MLIKIDEINNKIQIEINPKDYFITKTDGKMKDFNGEYALSHKISMDYCGKSDQVGCEQIFLNEKEYQKIRGLVDEVI